MLSLKKKGRNLGELSHIKKIHTDGKNDQKEISLTITPKHFGEHPCLALIMAKKKKKILEVNSYNDSLTPTLSGASAVIGHPGSGPGRKEPPHKPPLSSFP